MAELHGEFKEFLLEANKLKKAAFQEKDIDTRKSLLKKIDQLCDNTYSLLEEANRLCQTSH